MKEFNSNIISYFGCQSILQVTLPSQWNMSNSFEIDIDGYICDLKGIVSISDELIAFSYIVIVCIDSVVLTCI